MLIIDEICVLFFLDTIYLFISNSFLYLERLLKRQEEFLKYIMLVRNNCLVASDILFCKYEAI